MIQNGAQEMTSAVVRCRFCDAPLKHIFADLGLSPLANSYLNKEQLYQMEPFYPLQVFVSESRRNLWRLRVFFLLLGNLASACEVVHRYDIEALFNRFPSDGH
jgi:hypothetical protein